MDIQQENFVFKSEFFLTRKDTLSTTTSYGRRKRNTPGNSFTPEEIEENLKEAAERKVRIGQQIGTRAE